MFKEVTNMTWEDILKRKQVTLEDVLIYIIKRHRIPRKDKEKTGLWIFFVNSRQHLCHVVLQR